MIRLLTAWMLLFALDISAESIREYNTTITVHPSGSLHVEERITYDFGSHSRHGIFRDIPLMVKTAPRAPEVPVGLLNFTVQLDGRPVPYERSTFASATGGDTAHYRIGDPDKYVTGLHTYTLNYDAQRGVYPSSHPGMEAIRWNAVGAGSKVPTGHAVAHLILPPKLKREDVRIAVYTGRYGSTESRATYRWIDDHRVRFEVDDLTPNEALTVEANYPAGLLAQSADDLKATTADQLTGNWHWGAVAGFFLWIWYYVKRFGVGGRIGAVAPQYYPPEGLSLLESGLILDKFADKKDFSAAILELGALGYLEVHHPDDGDPFLRRTDRSAEGEALTPDQRFLLDDILFKEGETFAIETQSASRAREIYNALDTLNDMLYDWSVTSGQMRANPNHTRMGFLLTAGGVTVVLTLLVLISTFKFAGIESAMKLILSWTSFGMAGFLLMVSVHRHSYIGIIFGAFWLMMSPFGFLDKGDSLFDPPTILLPLLAAGIYYVYRTIGPFTPRGLETFRYLLGYRDFMKHVEEDRIRRFLEEDPHYLDRGLPYAVLFGLHKHWLSFYDALEMTRPVWYHGDLHRMNAVNRMIQQQTTPPPSGGGGYSGGGSFSGGGGGGGGVGSW